MLKLIRLSGAVLATALAATILTSCGVADKEAQSDSTRMLVGAGTPVPAAGETQAVATQRADAADDPEIWVDPKDSSRAIILGRTSKPGFIATISAVKFWALFQTDASTTSICGLIFRHRQGRASLSPPVIAAAWGRLYTS